MDKSQENAGPVVAGPSMPADLQSFIVLAFPFPQPIRDKDQKLRSGAQQLGREFFDGLVIMYSYIESNGLRSRAGNTRVFLMGSDSEGDVISRSPQLVVSIFNRRVTSSSSEHLEVAMLMFVGNSSSYHGPEKPLSTATMVWHKCPSLNSSQKIFRLNLTSSTIHPSTHLHLFIKSPSLKPQVAPFSRVSELTCVGKTIRSISPYDLTFLVYLRHPREQGDSDAVGILRGSREALSTITTHFESYSNFGEANLTSHPETMPSINFEEWDDDSDLEDSEIDAHVAGLSAGNGEKASLNLSGLAGRLKEISGGQFIPITDHAYKTWHAMIYYSHTGTIYFAPLSSDKRRKKRAIAEATHRSEHPHAPALVSCKSIYRLSEKYDIKELADLSICWFRAQLTPQVVMKELFKRHTIVYPRVKEMLLNYLFKYWKEMRQTMLDCIKAFSSEEKVRHYWLVETVFEKFAPT